MSDRKDEIATAFNGNKVGARVPDIQHSNRNSPESIFQGGLQIGGLLQQSCRGKDVEYSAG